MHACKQLMYLRESKGGEGGLARVSESVRSHGKVAKERVHMSGIFGQWVLLLVTEESLKLLKRHVLHVLTVGIKLLTNLVEGGKRERERERTVRLKISYMCMFTIPQSAYTTHTAEMSLLKCPY